MLHAHPEHSSLLIPLMLYVPSPEYELVVGGPEVAQLLTESRRSQGIPEADLARGERVVLALVANDPEEAERLKAEMASALGRRMAETEIAEYFERSVP